MKARLTYLLLICSLVLVGCKRRPLTDFYSVNLYLELEIEKEDANDPDPAGMSVNFYDVTTHDMFVNTVVGPTGGYLSILPGCYDLIVYNYDTEYTIVRNDNHTLQAEAYTNEAPGQVRRSYENLMRAMAAARAPASRDYGSEPLINQPDHLYVGKIDKVEIPLTEDKEETVKIHVVASTLIEKYKLIVRYVTGMEYISAADAYVSGQASSKLLHDKTPLGGPATLYVPLSAISKAEFNATFTTFGKYEKGDGKVWVVLRLADLNGKIYTWEFDVTDQVDSGSHVIIIDADLRVEPTTLTGGFNPDIDEWGEVITHLNI